MVLLLLPLLLLLDLAQTQAWGKLWQPTVRQEIVLEDQDLTYNSLNKEDQAMTNSCLGGLVQREKTRERHHRK